MPARKTRSSGRRAVPLAWAIGAMLALPGTSPGQPALPDVPDSEPIPTDPKRLERDDADQAAPAGMTVRDCILIGLSRQPTLRAHRASIASSEASYRALCNANRVVRLLTPDLDVRKQQAILGIQAGKAQLAQAEWDVIYAVTRNYYTVVYAREQARVAELIQSRLEFTLENVRVALDFAAPDVNQSTAEKLVIYIGTVRQQVAEARASSERALAALREAMGVDQDEPVQVAEQGLPEFRLEITRDYVVRSAQARRGELTQARLGGEIVGLEVAGQAARTSERQRLVRTFASGADIHANPIPAPDFGQNYRPGAIGLEMPPNIFGGRSERVTKAAHLADRAGAMADKAEDLVALEAANAYHRWQQDSEKIRATSEALEAARNLNKRIDLAQDPDFGLLKAEEILAGRVLIGQTFAAFNQARYEGILTLADLERITAGGVRVNWPAPLPTLELPTNGDSQNGDDDTSAAAN